MKFNLIVDRASLACNDTSAIRHCLRVCQNQLKNDGMYIGIDWYSTDCDAYPKRGPIKKFTIQERILLTVVMRAQE